MKALWVYLIVVFASAAWLGGPAAQTLQTLYQTGKVEFVEDVVFGNDDDEDDGVLFHPSAVCVDDGGAVFILDYKMFCIKKFDSNGEHLLTFSRQGEGPGELARAYRMAMTPRGRLAVFDSDNHRITVFDRDGEYVESQGFQGWVTGFYAAADESFVVLYSVMKEDWMKNGSFYKVAHLAPDLGTETAIDSGYVRDSEIIQATDNSMTSVGKPFVGRYHVGALPGGDIVVAHGDEYRLRLLSPRLEPVREVTREVPRIKVTEGDKAEYYEDFQDSEENFRILVREKVRFPKYKPYISDLCVDDEGYILVETYERTGSDDTMCYDVFTPDGEFVNRVEMIALKTSARFKNGYLYMSKFSDDDLPVVIRYRPQANEETANP